jgi:hypothetical protein
VGRPARSVLVAAAAAVLWAAPAPAGVPAHQTFRLVAQKVSVELPAGWGKALQPDREWQWHAVAPGSVAHLYVNALPTTKDVSVLGPAYAAALEKPFGPGDPHWAFSSIHVRVASLAAFKISFRYRNLTIPTTPVEVATIYTFVHGGLFYVFDYVAGPTRLATMQPVFEQSIGSLRFLGGP